MKEKIDFRKSLDSYKGKRHEFRLIEVPPLQYIMIDGSGDPNTSSAFQEALEALYPVAYRLKFASKRELGRDYVVPPLEGLWWAEDMTTFTVKRDKSAWLWTMMIMVPDWVPGSMVDAALEAAGAKTPPARLDDVRLEQLTEGLCVQTLHVGSFDDEAEVLERMHDEYVPSKGLSMVGKHHEIYLSDFRKTAPEKLRTLLRQPVAPMTEQY